MKAVIYLRKSTDDNRHQKASLDDQRAWAFEYVDGLRRNGTDVEIVKMLEEKKTAKCPGRPLFGEMMGLIYSGKADAVITWDIDRLSRNEVDEGTIKWAIRQGKVKAVHTHNSIYTEHELLTMGIFLSLGAEEIAKLRQRVMRRMKSMVAEGGLPYQAPYGYRNKDGGAVVDVEEAAHLKEIFALRKKGFSMKQVADHLNDAWIKPRFRLNSRNIWTSSNVDKILRNEFYAGVVRFAGEVGEWVHERIVSRDLWDEVNGKNRVNVGYKKHDFALKGIVTDPDGKPLKASLIKGRYVYYHSADNSVNVSQKHIFKELSALVANWVFPEEFHGELEKLVRKEIDEEHSATIAELEASRSARAKNENSMDRIISMYRDGKIDDTEYGKYRSELLAERARLNDAVDGFSALDMSLAEKTNVLVKLLKDLSATYESGDDVLKGYILKAGLVKLSVDSEKRLEIQQKEVFEHLFAIGYLLGTPKGNRTPATTVRGWCPNR